MPTGAVSSTQKVQHAKKYSTRGGKLAHDNIARNVGYALKDNIPTIKYNLQISSEKVFPKKTVSKEGTSSKEHYQAGDRRQRDRVVRASDLKSVGRYLFTLVLKSPNGEWQEHMLLGVANYVYIYIYIHIYITGQNMR